MAKVIASGDHHFDEHSSRWDECLRIHDWIAEQVEEHQPDAFLSAGDIYERASTPKEREAVAAWLTRIAAVCPVVIARGNHDRPQDLYLLRRLCTHHPVTVEEGAGVHYAGDAAIATLAWPSRSLLRSLVPDMSAEGIDDAARAALRTVLGGMAAELEAFRGDKLLLMHAMVDGSVTSVGQPLVGCEFNVGLADLAAAGCHAGILGHIHAPQEWEHAGVPYIYTGSPFRTAFGETEEKSIALWDGGRLTRIHTPATRMELRELTWDPATQRLEGDLSGLDGAEVRIRYQVPADQREAARGAIAEATERLGGAARIKTEEQVVPADRVRAPEVTTVTTLREKLAIHWASKGIDLPAARAERIFARAEELNQ